MTRWQVAALAALVLIAATAKAEPHKVSVGSAFDSVPGALLGANAGDTVWIRRLHGTDTLSARVTADLVPRLRAALMQASRMDVTLGLPEICETCRDQLPILFSFGAPGPGANRLDVYAWFREAQARFVMPGGTVGLASFRADAPELLAMVKRMLPGDSVVRRYTWHPRPDSLLREGPPGDDGSSGFGEHVYVEVLPEAIVKVPPAYPDDARERGVDGTVMLQVLVDRSGNVADTRVTKSVPLLDDAAVAAVRQWKFKPGTSKGKPAAIWVDIPIKFTLH